MLNQLGRAVFSTAAFALIVPFAPPSFPSSSIEEDPGTNARACWSTWTGFGVGPEEPHVRSYQGVSARLASQTSKVEKKTGSGLFGSTATAWSYQFCG